MLTEMIRKANLVRSGLVDKYDDQRKRPLADHLKEFQISVADKGGTPTGRFDGSTVKSTLDL
jgi:hypothetical protein